MKSERLGLLRIAASLLVIALIFGLFFQDQQKQRLHRIEVQGVSLVRQLTNLSLERLVPGDARQGILEIVRSLQSNSEFAYAVVENLEGQPLRAVAEPGLIPPAAPVVTGPSTWFGQRDVQASTGNRQFEEFYAPVLDADNRVAQVRLGYRNPPLFAAAEDLSLFAMIALPVFLLVPLFYLIMKRMGMSMVIWS